MKLKEVVSTKWKKARNEIVSSEIYIETEQKMLYEKQLSLLLFISCEGKLLQELAKLVDC